MSQPDYITEDESIRKFLTDPQTIELLLRSVAPYPEPTSVTKSTFDTKTSAINVTPPSHARYNIEEIREESLWLSERTRIDEVSALRIAVLEWQTRPAKRLLSGSTVGAYTHDHEQFMRASRLAQSQHGLEQIAVGQQGLVEGADSQSDRSARRRRLIEILLAERRYVLKCSEYILEHTLCILDDNETARKSKHEVVRWRWLEDIGLGLLSHWSPDRAANGKSEAQSSTFLVDAIGAIRHRLQSLGSGSGWSEADSGEDFEIMWGCNQAIEIIHIMQIMQALLQSATTVLQGALVLPWFRLMGECGFLDDFQLVSMSYNLQHSLIIPLALPWIPNRVQPTYSVPVRTDLAHFSQRIVRTQFTKPGFHGKPLKFGLD